MIVNLVFPDTFVQKSKYSPYSTLCQVCTSLYKCVLAFAKCVLVRGVRIKISQQPKEQFAELSKHWSSVHFARTFIIIFKYFRLRDQCLNHLTRWMGDSCGDGDTDGDGDDERAVVESHDPVSRAVMARLSSIVGALSPQLQQSGIENLRSLSHAETALYLISAYRAKTKVTWSASQQRKAVRDIHFSGQIFAFPCLCRSAPIWS